jgi:hypothetical protein
MLPGAAGPSSWPAPAVYYLMTAAGIAASLAIIAATFPSLRVITGPEAAETNEGDPVEFRLHDRLASASISLTRVAPRMLV